MAVIGSSCSDALAFMQLTFCLSPTKCGKDQTGIYSCTLSVASFMCGLAVQVFATRQELELGFVRRYYCRATMLCAAEVVAVS